MHHSIGLVLYSVPLLWDFFHSLTQQMFIDHEVKLQAMWGAGQERIFTLINEAAGNVLVSYLLEAV